MIEMIHIEYTDFARTEQILPINLKKVEALLIKFTQAFSLPQAYFIFELVLN